MGWNNGHYSVAHGRETWAGGDAPLFVHCPWPDLKGAKGSRQRGLYFRAKHAFDMEAAEKLIVPRISDRTMDAIIDFIIANDAFGGRLIMPHPAFDDEDGHSVSTSSTPSNALPFAYANYLNRKVGCAVDEEIVQSARVGRTKLSKWARFLYQPSFGGVVRRDAPYIIVDDVASTCGTMACLRSYILRNGGQVLFATAMANSNGQNCHFAIQEQTVNQLLASFGTELTDLWAETIGHGIDCLTEAEGRFLAEWSYEEQAKGCRVGEHLLRRLRGQLDEAAATDR